MALKYVEYGNKREPLMIFLHGGGVSGWMWDKQIEYFRDFHCIVPQLPEHGQNNKTSHLSEHGQNNKTSHLSEHRFDNKGTHLSEHGQNNKTSHLPEHGLNNKTTHPREHSLNNELAPFSIKGSAQEIIQLIDETANGKEVIAVGFSLGAQVLMEMMSARPDLIDIAVINSALVRPNRYAQKWIRPTVRLSFPLIKRRWFSRLQAKTLYIDDANFETYFKESGQMTPDALVRVLEENMSFAIPENFANAKGNILVTVGEKEKTMMKKSAIDIVNANPNCVGVVIPDVGHGAPLAVPDQFNRLLEKWICSGQLPNGYPPIHGQRK